MSINRRAMAVVSGLSMVLALSAVSGHAATARQTNYLTFSGPVRLPGVTLPAGTYVFERADVATPRVVRVTSRDGHQVYFMGFTMLVDRPAGTTRLVSLGEAQTGTAPPILAWYPQNESTGHQFIWSRR